MRGRRLVLLLLLAVPCLARADETTGTVTGQAEVRTSTFYERRTDVLAPTIGGRLDLPSGARIRGQYLVDVITSSSVAVDIVASASVGVDPLARSTFRERRNEGSLAVSGAVDRTNDRLQLEGSLRYSHEPDYQSYAGGVSFAYALAERTTIVRGGLVVSRDEVFQTQRITDPATGDVTKTYVRVDQGDGFTSFVGSVGASRVVSHVLEIDLGYELSHLSGYLGNPYRRVVVDGFVVRERVPSQRLRHTLASTLRLARPRARGALHLMLRGYADDWSIYAFSAEGRWYQRLGPHVSFRSRLRFYQQTAAYFDSGQQVNAPSYPFGVDYTTANPRYAAMRSIEIGGSLVTRLGFLTGSATRPEVPEVEFTFDYRIADNRFGNAIAAAFALRMPIP